VVDKGKEEYLLTEPILASTTTIDRVSLIVNDLQKQIMFYTGMLQMQLFEQTITSAVLGTVDNPILYLNEDKTATRNLEATGLYHFALLYPDEESLARIVAHLIALNYLNYPTDHAMSKTTYVQDAEGNDIELYVRTLDRVQFVKVENQVVLLNKDGTEADTRAPLDLKELFSYIHGELDRDAVMPSGTSIGHVHIYGRSLEEMLAFYRDGLGFGESMMETWARMGEVGLADGKNHVIAFNTWKGADAPLVQVGARGLKYYVLNVNERDYEGIKARLTEMNIPLAETGDGILVKDPANVEILIEVKEQNK